MSTIIEEALRLLNDLETRIDRVSGTLPGEAREALSNRLGRAQSKVEALVASGSFSEFDLAEVANELIDGLADSGTNVEVTNAGEKITSREERAALLAQLEKSDGLPTRAARPTQPERGKVEQYDFFANQIINQCQIVKKVVDSQPRAEPDSREDSTPR
jgi:hypothetical protein